MTKKSTKNFKYLENEKSFKVKKNHFLSIVKGVYLSEIVTDLRVRAFKEFIVICSL